MVISANLPGGCREGEVVIHHPIAPMPTRKGIVEPISPGWTNRSPPFYRGGLFISQDSR